MWDALNLLANAVKFTQAGSVSLTMYYENDRLSIVVEDTGSGMTEEDMLGGTFQCVR